MAIKIRQVLLDSNKNGLKYLKILEDLDKHIFPDCPEIDPKKLWWIAFDNNIPVGFAGLDINRFKDKAFLCKAGILKDWRGQGIHKRLISVRERKCRKLSIYRIITYVNFFNVNSANNLTRSGYSRYNPPIKYGVEYSSYYIKSLKNDKKKKNKVRRTYDKQILSV